MQFLQKKVSLKIKKTMNHCQIFCRGSKNYFLTTYDRHLKDLSGGKS